MTPPHWASARLGELADIQLGKMLDKNRTAGTLFRYLRNINVRWDYIDTSDLLEMPFKQSELVRFDLRSGDVLVCEGGEPGRSAVWPLDTSSIKYQKALHRVRLEGGILPRWLVFHLYFDSHRGALTQHLTGTTIKHFPKEALHDYVVRLPPVAEQCRIVDAIESYFTQLDDATATLERVRRNLKRYRASVLKAAVEGRLVPTEAELARAEGRDYEPASVLLERILTERRRRWEENDLAKMKANGRTPTSDAWKEAYQPPEAINMTRLPELPEGWTWTSVDAVGDVLLGRQRAPQFLTGRYTRPYLRVANIKDDRIEFDDLEEMDFDPRHFVKYQLKPGDILVSEGQSPELLGQSAIYRGGVEGLCFQKTLHRFRPVEAGPSSEYAQLVFRAHVKSGVFMRLGSITTNIAHLTLVKFKGAPFPLPPVNEQKRITTETHRISSEIDEAERVVDKQLVRLTRLRQSILKWAFEGRLVDQDPSDEPASVLLERIQAERAASATATSNRKPRRKGNSANA